MISYNKEKTLTKKFSQRKFFSDKSFSDKSKTAPSAAVLGGGDIGFPLIFAGVVLKSLVLKNPLPIAFLKVSIIPVCTAAALLILLLKGQKDKYYPAMPFLSAGAILGYVIVLLI